MDTQLLIQTAAAIAGGAVPESVYKTDLAEGVLDNIAKNCVRLAMKIEEVARKAAMA